jgi:hypothetical protein
MWIAAADDQLLLNLLQAKMSELSNWLSDQWKNRHVARPWLWPGELSRVVAFGLSAVLTITLVSMTSRSGSITALSARHAKP